MPNPTITLCYRKIIDAQSVKLWEKMVFDDSYREYILQAQLYDQARQYHTFAELLQQVPRAEQLHFLVSSAVIGYLRQLNDTVPDIIDNLGRHFLTFTQFRFEIINSHLRDISKHQIAINFYSNPLVWHSTIGDFLLVSASPESQEETLTHLFQIQPYLSIHSLSNPDLKAL